MQVWPIGTDGLVAHDVCCVVVIIVIRLFEARNNPIQKGSA